MRPRALVLASALAGALAGAAPAAAQDALFFGNDIFHSPVAGMRATQIPVTSAGSLVVEWEADPDTCASVGRCGLRGTTTWRLPSTGQIFLFEARRGGRRLRSGFLAVSGDFPGGQPAAARVRSASGMCADSGGGAGYVDLEERDGAMTIGIGEMAPALITSRCAGPLLEDVRAALPVVRMPFRQLRRGRTRLDVDGAGTFVAHGLRGSTRADLELRLGTPERADEGEAPPAVRRRRMRYVSNRFRVVSVSGEVALDVAGAAD